MTALFAAMLSATIKVTIVSAIALSAAALLRDRSAAMRHWVLSIGVACAAVVPLLQFVVPTWHLRSVVGTDGVLATIQDLPAAATTATAAYGPTVLQRAANITGAAWLTGIAVAFLILIVGLARLAWLGARATRIVDGSWHDTAAAMARAYGLKRTVKLLLSPHTSLLATWGLVRPRIIFPACARGWSDERLRIVLGHELAHIRRRDWMVQIAVECLAAVYWFNPIVWVLRRRINQESEQAADDAVLGLGVNGGEYASELVALARSLVGSRRMTLVPASSMARQSGLERRIRAMLNGHLNRTPITRSACIAIVVALAAVTIPLAGLRAQSGPASLYGSLANQLGGPLSNVVLTLTNTATSAKTQQRTDASGRFAFTELSAGTYNLEAMIAGFMSLRENVTLAAGDAVTRDLTLPVGNLQETITVTSDGQNLAAPPPPQPRRTPLPTPTYDPAEHPCAQAGACIVPPTKMVDVKPVYPWNHRDVEGAVQLVARIGTDGLVKTIGVESAPAPEFAQAMVDAVSQWQFSPTYLDGKAIEVTMRVAGNFRVQ